MTQLLFFLIITSAYPAANSSGQPNLLEINKTNRFRCYSTDRPVVIKYGKPSLRTGWYYVVDSSKSVRRKLYNTKRKYFLNPVPIITAKNIRCSETHSNSLYGSKYFGIKLELDEDGPKLWSVAKNYADSSGKSIAFVLNNRLLLVSNLWALQLDNIVIEVNRGDFSSDEVEDFKRLIDRER